MITETLLLIKPDNDGIFIIIKYVKKNPFYLGEMLLLVATSSAASNNILCSNILCFL